MFTVKKRVYGKASDGRTILIHTPGMKITDDAARAAGLLKGKPKDVDPATGLTILSPAGEPKDDAQPPAQPLSRLNLAELRATCEAEGVDPRDANTRAEYIEAIEAARAAAAGDNTGDDDED